MNVIAKIHDEKTYSVTDLRVQFEFWLAKEGFDKLNKRVAMCNAEGVTSDIVVGTIVSDYLRNSMIL